MGLCASKDARTSEIDAALREIEDSTSRDPPIKVLFLGEPARRARESAVPCMFQYGRAQWEEVRARRRWHSGDPRRAWPAESLLSAAPGLETCRRADRRCGRVRKVNPSEADAESVRQGAEPRRVHGAQGRDQGQPAPGDAHTAGILPGEGN